MNRPTYTQKFGLIFFLSIYIFTCNLPFWINSNFVL